MAGAFSTLAVTMYGKQLLLQAAAAKHAKSHRPFKSLTAPMQDRWQGSDARE
jgi:hypothetical protein